MNKNEVINFKVEYNKIHFDGKTNEIDVILNENMTREDAFSKMWYLLNFVNIGKNCNYYVNGIEIESLAEIRNDDAVKNFIKCN